MSTSIEVHPGQVRKILVCQLRQIGDVLLATPSVELLAKRFPSAEIHFFTEKKCVPMLEHNPHIHKIWEVDKSALSNLLKELAYYKKIADEGFDLIVDFQQLPRIRWVVAMSGAKWRLSFPPHWYTRLLYTHWTQPGPNYAGAFKAGILAPLGIFWEGERPRLYLTEAEKTEARSFFYRWGIGPDHKVVTLDVTHRRVTRRWPLQSYATLMDALARQYPEIRFLVSFGPGEESTVKELRDLCICKAQVVISPVLLSLRQMAACISNASVHIGNCSAPRHIAVGVGTPTVTFLGATSTGWTYPSPEHIDFSAGLPCQPCNRNTCANNLRCMAELTPEQVFPAIVQHLTDHCGFR